MMQVRFIAIIFIFLHRIFTHFFVMLIFSHIKVHRKFCKSCKVFWCVWNLLLKLAYGDFEIFCHRYVGNLDRRCTEEFLKQVFGKIAPVERCKMIYDVSTWCAFLNPFFQARKVIKQCLIYYKVHRRRDELSLTTLLNRTTSNLN